MKKLFCLILAFVFVLGSFSFAETVETRTITSPVDFAKYTVDGSFKGIEVTEVQDEYGYVKALHSEKLGLDLLIGDFKFNKVKNADDYVSLIKKEGAKNIETFKANDIEYVIYDKDSDQTVVGAIDEPENGYEFVLISIDPKSTIDRREMLKTIIGTKISLTQNFEAFKYDADYSDGTWESLETVDLKAFKPSSLIKYELTEKDKTDGFIGILANADETINYEIRIENYDFKKFVDYIIYWDILEIEYLKYKDAKVVAYKNARGYVGVIVDHPDFTNKTLNIRAWFDNPELEPEAGKTLVGIALSLLGEQK